MIEENIKKLKLEFNTIKELGYVKTVRNGPTGVGATFEKLLKKEEESFEIPDYYGIEIKTRRAYSKSYITLFNAVPTGSMFHETKRLRDNYGYPSKKDKNLKCLYAEIFCNQVTKVGLWYYFELKIDKDKNKLFLVVYDYKREVIDESTYWDLDILKEKLERKLQILALVKAWTNKIEGIECFKYYKINFYILKDFNCFIEAFENGKIKILLKIDSHIEPEKYGMVDEHGVGFSISEENLLEIFDLYR
ncbi:MAG: MvaI/BcnI family restriction endonuclease [Bacilli bacterium]|nr:MvaI/BcnI family restriction endonuclease [Bacilli bacterium]